MKNNNVILRFMGFKNAVHLFGGHFIRRRSFRLSLCLVAIISLYTEAKFISQSVIFVVSGVTPGSSYPWCSPFCNLVSPDFQASSLLPLLLELDDEGPDRLGY